MPDLTPGSPVPPSIAALIPDFDKPVMPPLPKPMDDDSSMDEDTGLNADKMLEAMRSVPSAPIAPNGIFRHPPEFTPEEWDVIVAGLKAHLPMYAIAMKVHCERHFLVKKISELKEVAQVVIDAKEGLIDEAEYQLVKNARAGSMSAIIYLLDHLGQSRGYGEQKDAREPMEDVHISFGEISQADIKESQRLIEEANKKVTPTLAGELEAMEGQVPGQISAHDLAVAEDTVKTMTQIQNITNPPPQSAPDTPSLSQQPAQPAADDNMSFWEDAFADGGESPFGAFS